MRSTLTSNRAGADSLQSKNVTPQWARLFAVEPSVPSVGTITIVSVAGGITTTGIKMGNHTVDCEFCGQDQRLFGEDCCEQYTKFQETKERAQRARETEQQAYLARFGLKPHGNSLGNYTLLHVDDVIAALKLLESGRYGRA